MSQDRDTDTLPSVDHRLATVRQKMGMAAKDAEREPGDITLIAVSKTFGPEAIIPVLDIGHRVFGENRVQEATEKWPSLRASYEDVRLHLIGSLQTNKVKDAVANFDVIEVVDREKLAKALKTEMDRVGKRPDLLIQLNTGEESQKGGVLPAEADTFIEYCVNDLALPIKGVMAIPPADEPPAPHFALAFETARRHGLPIISMGMSADYETAIHLGATHVRVGSALFGPRQRKA